MNIEATSTLRPLRRNMIAAIAALLFLPFLSSCSEDDLSSTSVVTADQIDYTEFDYWLQRNYVAPYNIAFKYRYEDNESDMDYYTIPARYDAAVKLAHIVKYVCLEAYDEVAGITFTRSYFPKLIFTIGEWEYKNNGTFILGTAEGGRKIMLSGANYIDQYSRNATDLNHYYLKTIHHEFTHILNQTKEYSADFKLITGADYVADKWSESPYNSGNLQRGFISTYAQHSDTEDFAEMLSMFICYSEEQWNAWMAQAGTNGARLIDAKLDIVSDYMLSTFNIDIYLLRNAMQRRQRDLTEGRIDLTDLTK